jgi:hypothetical protein
VNSESAGRPHALRTALIWRDEVMSDVVADAPKKITIGHKGKPTFIVPDVGLPPNFAIVTPGNRGYLLTLGDKMRGTICIDGKEQDVQEYVQANDAPGGFSATPISGRDWGVVELDESGDYKLFFQFVAVEAPLDNNADMFSMVTMAMAVAMLFLVGITGAIILAIALASGSMEEAIPRLAILMFAAVSVAYLMSHPGSAARVILARTAIGIGGVLGLLALAWVQSQLEWSFLEWVTRGALVIIGGTFVFGLGFSLATSDAEQQASTGFSIILHGALLIGTIVIYDSADDPNVWPGPRALTGNYLVSRDEPLVKPPEVKPLPALKANKDEAAAKNENKKELKTATKNDEGASGGKGDTERARHKDAKDDKPDPPKVAFFEDKNKAMIDNILDKNMSNNIGKFTGIKSDITKKGSIGFGPGAGTGVGDGTGTGTTKGSKGKGTGGGGQVEGDFVTNKGKVDQGKERPGGTGGKGAGPKEVSVAVGEMSGDPGGYTEDEINRVVKRSAGMFRACYQKELNRTPGIGGKIVVRFKIGADGAVITASPAGGTTLANEAVKECVARNVNRLKFPPKGAVANVTYPFLFSPGG